MSDFEEKVGEMLSEAFPQATIKSQYMITYMGQQLFFDYYLPAFNLLVECQGRQHYKYVPHFHGNKQEFKRHQYRDSLKKEWAKKNRLSLFEVPYDDLPENAVVLFDRIYDEMDL